MTPSASLKDYSSWQRFASATQSKEFSMITQVAGPETLKYIEGSKDVHLHILDRGTGHPIVFLPGWPFSNEVFESQIPTLIANGRRVIVPSLRGFGRSDETREACTYNDYADDLKGILHGLDLDHVVLCGHSLGAAIAIRYMSRHQGVRVSKLVLCDAAAPVWTRRQGFNAGLSLIAVDELINNLQVNRSQTLRELIKIFRYNETSLTLAQTDALYTLAMQASPVALIQSLVEMRNGDLRPDLEQIHIPTAIFHGVKDRFCPFAFAAELADGIKHSTVIRFEKSGHLPFLEESETFKLKLLEFASEIN
jgi:pimeloyl-ACP methyl ester carboxylesterase